MASKNKLRPSFEDQLELHNFLLGHKTQLEAMQRTEGNAWIAKNFTGFAPKSTIEKAARRAGIKYKRVPAGAALVGYPRIPAARRAESTPGRSTAHYVALALRELLIRLGEPVPGYLHYICSNKAIADVYEEFEKERAALREKLPAERG
jgi:hypothetical protein